MIFTIFTGLLETRTHELKIIRRNLSEFFLQKLQIVRETEAYQHLKTEHIKKKNIFFMSYAKTRG